MKDRTPYTYLIGWSNHNKYYYGRRTAKNCTPTELWERYFTSSYEVQKFRSIHGEPDIVQVRKIFDTIDDCKRWEMKFLTRVNARLNPKFLNLVNSDYKLNPINTGRCSSMRRENIRIARLSTTKQVCVHCGKSVDPGNFKQYHGDKCKSNPLIDPIVLGERTERARRSMHSMKLSGKYQKPKTPKGTFECPHCNKLGTNYGAMHRFHFENCIHNPKSTETVRNTKMNIRKTCEYCHKETNIGNYVKHHGINCIQYPLSSDNPLPSYVLSDQVDI